MAFALATIAAAPPAFADAIDGEWCSPRGQNLLIEGQKIRIPSGATIEGTYQRHEFAYEAPAGDPETWHRCNVTSSLFCHRRIYSGDPLCHMTDLLNLLHDGSPQQVRG